METNVEVFEFVNKHNAIICWVKSPIVEKIVGSKKNLKSIVKFNGNFWLEFPIGGKHKVIICRPKYPLVRMVATKHAIKLISTITDNFWLEYPTSLRG